MPKVLAVRIGRDGTRYFVELVSEKAEKRVHLSAILATATGVAKSFADTFRVAIENQIV